MKCVHAKKHPRKKHPRMLRRLLYFFGRRSYAAQLQKDYRVAHINANFLRQLPPPYVLLANHVNNEDPFIYNILCPHPIAWVIGKSIERDSKFFWLLRVIRTVSRNKEAGDFDTIQQIRQRIAEGEVVGIFPEGQTCLTGVSQAIPEATAKLLRFLKVPVVTLRNEGGYFAQPRWCYRRRISPAAAEQPGIRLHYQLLFDAEQIRTAKLTEIQHKLAAALYYDPYTPENKQKAAPYLDLGLKKQNLAEHLELLYYTCLSCQSPDSLGAMHSKGMLLCCPACGAAWRITDDSYALQLSSPANPNAKHDEGVSYNLQQYYRQQLQLLQQWAQAGKLSLRRGFARLRYYSQEDERLRLRSGGSRVWRGGSLALGPEGLRLYADAQQAPLYHFLLDQLFGSHVFKQNIWEFRAYTSGGQSVFFVLEFAQRTDSAFVFLDSLQALR